LVCEVQSARIGCVWAAACLPFVALVGGGWLGVCVVALLCFAPVAGWISGRGWGRPDGRTNSGSQRCGFTAGRAPVSSSWTDVQAVRRLECLGICVCVCPLAPDGFPGSGCMRAWMSMDSCLATWRVRCACLVVVRSLLLRVCVWVDVCSRWALFVAQATGAQRPRRLFSVPPRPRL